MARDLVSRLDQLDSAVDGDGFPAPVHLSAAFVETMLDVSRRGTPQDETEVLDPDDADALVAESLLLQSLLGVWPWLTNGPSATECAQHWIATGRPPWRPSPVNVPDRAAFRPPQAPPTHAAPDHPAEFGFFTSSATDEFGGMWRTMLEQSDYTDFWPKPWSTWVMKPVAGAPVLHLEGASDWARLLEKHHLDGPHLLHADWSAIASEYDAVHFTPRAVCAVQGYRLETSAGLTAPVYWDVESTLWLRWCFESSSLVATEEADT